MKMKDEEIAPRIVHVAETISTNSLIRDLMALEKLPEGSVAVADFQTAGRGQVGNKWESERGRNLTFSLIVYPEHLPANRQFLISQISALSVKETLDHYVADVTVKWPNDVYWRDKKICGMLIENELAGSRMFNSIIGIGINLNQREFRSDAPNPVSLCQIIGREVDREEVLERFLSIFYAHYLSTFEDGEPAIRTLYRQALYRGEGFFPYEDKDGRFEAEIADVELTGHLLLRTREGETRRYAFKEVSCVL